MTQEQINAVADMLAEMGVPESLNRWRTMTPESLAALQARLASMVEAEKNRRSHTMSKQVGPKEKALRDMRDSTTPTEQENPMPKKTRAAATKALDEAEQKAATKKAPRAKKVPQAPEGRATRGGGKTEIIRKLLARKHGCTAKEVMAACGWPSVSMPQQAKLLGVELHKAKDEGGATRYADHPIS